MATSATSYSAWGGSWDAFRLKMTVTRDQVDIAGNRSLIRSRVWVESRNGSSFSYNSRHRQTIDGALMLDDVMINRSVAANSSALVMDNSRWVSHAADGSKPGLYSGANFENGITGLLAVSVTMNVDTIPRATTPSFSGSFTTGAAKTISLPRASSSFTHDVSYTFGSKSGTIATGAGASASWTPPESLLTEIPNATSGTGTIKVVTKSGSTVIGTKTKSFTLAAASSVVPTVSAVAWSDANATIASAIGAYVQGLSKIKGVVTAAGVQGSTIKTRQTVIDGKTVSEGSTVTPTSSGTVAASGRATDSRGRVGTRTANISVLAYSPPDVTTFEVARATSANVASPTGTYLQLKLAAAIQSLLVAAVQKNSMAIKVYTKASSTPTWTARNSLTAALSYNSTVLITGGGVYLQSTSYDVRVEISDKTGMESMVVLETTVATAAVALDLNGTSVGVGKYHERGALDVAGDVYATNYHSAGDTPWIPFTYATGYTAGTATQLRYRVEGNTLHIRGGATGTFAAGTYQQVSTAGIPEALMTRIRNPIDAADRHRGGAMGSAMRPGGWELTNDGNILLGSNGLSAQPTWLQLSAAIPLD